MAKPPEKWPADRVERRPIGELTPYAKNARTHSDAQIEQIARSMGEWGWTNPVLVDEAGAIIAGHGRILAARKLGLAEVPVMVAEGWTEAQKAAYVLADNQLALNAGWDMETLAGEVKGLSEWGFELSLLGFSDIDALLAAQGTAGLTDPDDAPEAPPNPVAATGDLWGLGRHWLLCGDATSADDTQKVLGGVSPHLMVTDPPYGVNYDPAWRNRAIRSDGTPQWACHRNGKKRRPH
jgi:ParB-like chromosome segregation protein Spo0J